MHLRCQITQLARCSNKVPVMLHIAMVTLNFKAQPIPPTRRITAQFIILNTEDNQSIVFIFLSRLVHRVFVGNLLTFGRMMHLSVFLPLLSPLSSLIVNISSDLLNVLMFCGMWLLLPFSYAYGEGVYGNF